MIRQKNVDRTRGRRGFTLVELLVVIGIIAVLISVLLPALNTARRQSKMVQCSSNMRQLATALVMYANEFKGHFPMNGLTPATGTTHPTPLPWYSNQQIGRYLPKINPNGPNSIMGADNTGRGAFVCPDDDQSVRSYALNYFASSLIGGSTEAGSKPYRLKYGMKDGSKSMLLLEVYSVTQGAGKDYYYCGLFAGWQPALTASAGQKFGGAGGFAYTAGRFGTTRGEIAYYRHRPPKEPGTAQEAKGLANFAFADGHVASFRPTDLYTPATGRSNFTAIWSPKLDYQYP